MKKNLAIQSKSKFFEKEDRKSSSENKQMKSSNDKLFKFRDIFNYFLEVWWSNYSGGEHLNIDETIILFRGRLNIKQYNPLKPNKFGVKAFSLADSSTGYVIRWYIYAGIKNIQKFNEYSFVQKKDSKAKERKNLGKTNKKSYFNRKKGFIVYQKMNIFFEKKSFYCFTLLIVLSLNNKFNEVIEVLLKQKDSCNKM